MDWFKVRIGFPMKISLCNEEPLIFSGARQLEFDEFFGVSFIPCTTWVDDPIDQTRVKQLEGVKTKFVVVAQANK